MFASYKKNALIGRVLSADAKTEVGGEGRFMMRGYPRHSEQSSGAEGKRMERADEQRDCTDQN